jgi:hypothetical protein
MLMKTNNQKITGTYNTPGERLSHILDQLGFKQGRGRVIEFQNYLTSTSPKYFTDLKYTTVRAWFQDHAPPMRKIDAIIETLQVNYRFQHDVSHIKTWWKAGGFYPFFDKTPSNHPSVVELMEKIAIIKEKLPFIIMSIITEETGKDFKSLSGSELIHISDKASSFADNFLDPLNIDCPDEYLRVIVRHELKRVMNSRPT